MWFYLVKPILYLISYLPFSVLYKLSDAIKFVLQRLLKYRADVIQKNIEYSFPEKTELEKSKIIDQFYTQLADLFVEGIKFISISKSELLNRCKPSTEYSNVFNRLYKDKKSVIVVMSHSGNWEWSPAMMKLMFPYKMVGIYKSIHQEKINHFIKKTRSRFGTTLVGKKEVLRDIIGTAKDDLTVWGFIADQYPGRQKDAHKVHFLNQETAFISGYAQIAKKFNLPVVYVYIKKIKRGYYEVDAQLIEENPKGQDQFKLVDKFAQMLENDINKQPFNWLWSHKRWKKRKIN